MPSYSLATVFVLNVSPAKRILIVIAVARNTEQATELLSFYSPGIQIAQLQWSHEYSEGASIRRNAIKTHKCKDYWALLGRKLSYGKSIKVALIKEFKEESKPNIKNIHWAATQEAINSSKCYKTTHFILLTFIAKSDTEEFKADKKALAYQPNKPIIYYQAKPFTTARLV